eukprot:TRINITY_DN1517_c1_g1_i2.p1 TRINITY_DN1517_c1_g1~~TRINITY_DN1517_c1_g1_i2.p1  ORF type:complete len:670 (+),score=281.78 TRINITY_DN1517_c1_g1_i2:267-2276(+)
MLNDLLESVQAKLRQLGNPPAPSSKRTGVREHMVQRAVKFLSYPSVRASADTHAKFLHSKGLTDQEIKEAFARISFQDNEQQPGDEAASGPDPITNSLPPAAYEEFIFRLMQADADAVSLYQAFSSFIEMFKSGLGASYDIDDRSAMVANQIELISDRVLAFYERNRFVGTQQIVMECVEKYLMTSLHGMLFEPGESDDVQLGRKIGRLQRFVRIQHLDIAPHYRDDTLWAVAQQEMQNMSLHKAPRDKLLCIVKACKIIYSAMQMMSHDESISADSLLPVLIFNVIQANPADLNTNINYMQYFRHPSHMRHESGYFFVSFCTAVAFIQQLDASSLSIDRLEYERQMSEASESSDEQQRETQQQQQAEAEAAGSLLQGQRRQQLLQFNANDFMLQSCAGGDLDAIEKLVDEQQADVNYVKRAPAGHRLSALRVGDFPLRVACRLGNTNVVKYLLSKGANVNQTSTEDGRTVLHLECIGHELGRRKVYNFETMRLLVHHGADVDQLDSAECSAVDYANRSGQHVAAFVRSLVAERASPSGSMRSSASVPADEGRAASLVELIDQHWSRPPLRTSSSDLQYSVAKMYTQPLLLIHHVKDGESLSELSAKYGVPEAAILRFNGLDSSKAGLSGVSFLHIPISKNKGLKAVQNDVATEEFENKKEMLARMKSV